MLLNCTLVWYYLRKYISATNFNRPYSPLAISGSAFIFTRQKDISRLYFFLIQALLYG